MSITATGNDHRLAPNGSIIPAVTYSDQPYVAIAADGAWVCVMTTGSGREGASGQHIISQRSTDHGKTWTDRVEIEPPSGPEASWAVIAAAPGGRLFVFYVYNRDNLRGVPAIDPAFSQSSNEEGYEKSEASSICRRVDSLGSYMFKYSDDYGKSWSADRYEIPVREFDIDPENATGGEVRFFWNVGRPFVSGTTVFLPIHKVGNFGYGFFTRSEGALLQSDDLCTVDDPATATWTTLPDGRVGIRAPEGAGPIAEEHSFSELSDGSIYVVYRTISGYPGCAYSRDRGRSWTTPDTPHRPDGRPLKNPRAANFAWSCGEGRYLYWFHNHGGPRIQQMHGLDASYPYQAPRNPAWLCGGVEIDGPDGKEIQWSEPVVAVYDDDPIIRMSYPDLVQDGEDFSLTYTNKHHARVHPLPKELLAGLWTDAAGGVPPAPDPVISVAGADSIEMPDLPEFSKRDPDREDYGSVDLRAGLSLELVFEIDELKPGICLFDSRDSWGPGIVLRVSLESTIELIGYDGQTRIAWDTDPGAVAAGTRHHLVAIVDGGPKIVSFVLDGRQLDGGAERQLGWGRFSPNLQHLNGARVARIARANGARVERVAVHDSALTTSEAVGRYRAGNS